MQPAGPSHPTTFILLVLALMLAGASVAWAVPEATQEAFASKYGGDLKPQWEVDSHGNWEAVYEREGKKFRADFTEEGRWIETERSLDFAELPASVQSAIQLQFGDREIAELEEVEHSERGLFYDVEFTEKGPNEDIEYSADGAQLTVANSASPAAAEEPDVSPEMERLSNGRTSLDKITPWGLLLEFGINLLTILVYAWGIYYRRHHNHKMMFLLLAFNIFLFPIFLLSSVLTLGFGFTIFALLALVRLRSENFDKAEVAYLLGAVALTFINSQLSADVEVVASFLVLLTAYLADHPFLWRSAYQTTQIRYRISDTALMLDRDYLTKAVAKEFAIDVNDIEIDRVARKEVRLTVVYRDRPSVEQPARKGGKKSGGKSRVKKKCKKEQESGSGGEKNGAEGRPQEPEAVSA